VRRPSSSDQTLNLQDELHADRRHHPFTANSLTGKLFWRSCNARRHRRDSTAMSDIFTAQSLVIVLITGLIVLAFFLAKPKKEG
jgi:hypothetical protein